MEAAAKNPGTGRKLRRTGNVLPSGGVEVGGGCLQKKGKTAMVVQMGLVIVLAHRVRQIVGEAVLRQVYRRAPWERGLVGRCRRACVVTP